jgi:HPt (histidine-containing phosphotransfer) domain-containing protein
MQDDSTRNASADGVEIVNWQEALRRVDGSEEALRELIEIFCGNECQKHMRCIREGLVNQDAVVVERAAHTLKSNADLFGASRAYEAAKSLEQLANAADLEGAARAWTSLERELGYLQSALASHAD